MNHPRRIVCLSDETAETLYLLGEQDRIVGVSGFSTRPPEVKSKPRISAFRDANFDAIVALKPDLVLTFSDVQAEITRQLVLRGLVVLNFNQRSIRDILDMIAMLARIVDKARQGAELVARLELGLDEIGATARNFAYRPTVYFEEWHDPLISGIGWVEEMVEIAGGKVIFPELRNCGKAEERVVDAGEVLRRDPEVIFASWCGMKVDFDAMCSRPGWREIRAVRKDHLYEIPSSCILQPGPAALRTVCGCCTKSWRKSRVCPNRGRQTRRRNAPPLSCKILYVDHSHFWGEVNGSPALRRVLHQKYERRGVREC